jgi:hypothetical protein
MNIRKHLTLIIGLTLPVLMIIAVAAGIFVPRLLNHPKTNFVYASQSIQDVLTPADKGGPVTPPSTKYYLHDVQKNASGEISEKDYKKMSLDTVATSPDGFKVETGSSDSFFGGGNYRQQYLVGHGASYKLNLKVDQNDYSRDFKFLGWVK